MIFRSGADKKGLLDIMDSTKSPMGARLLKRWLVFPLQSTKQINKRLQAVENLLKNSDSANTLANEIASCGDIERLASKLSTRKIQPRELIQLAASLKIVAAIKNEISNSSNIYLQEIGSEISTCQSSVLTIEKTLLEQAPANTLKGG